MAVSTLVALRHDPKFHWTNPPEVNFVDRLVFAKLKQMEIEPSGLCGDAEFLFTDQGNLILARLSSEGYREISRAQLLEPTSPFGDRKCAWPPPAYANRHVFARNDRELVCTSLAAAP